MAMSPTEMENAIYIVSGTFGALVAALIIWNISLQVGFGRLRKQLRKLEEDTLYREELNKRGYQEYGGPPAPVQHGGRHEMQRQTSVPASVYTQDHHLSRTASMAKGYSANSTGGYDNSAYDRQYDRGNSSGYGFGGAPGGIRVLPGGGGAGRDNFQYGRGDKTDRALKAAGKEFGGLARDVAQDVATDAATEKINGWFN